MLLDKILKLFCVAFLLFAVGCDDETKMVERITSPIKEKISASDQSVFAEMVKKNQSLKKPLEAIVKQAEQIANKPTSEGSLFINVDQLAAAIETAVPEIRDLVQWLSSQMENKNNSKVVIERMSANLQVLYSINYRLLYSLSWTRSQIEKYYARDNQYPNYYLFLKEVMPTELGNINSGIREFYVKNSDLLPTSFSKDLETLRVDLQKDILPMGLIVQSINDQQKIVSIWRREKAPFENGAKMVEVSKETLPLKLLYNQNPQYTGFYTVKGDQRRDASPSKGFDIIKTEALKLCKAMVNAARRYSRLLICDVDLSSVKDENNSTIARIASSLYYAQPPVVTLLDVQWFPDETELMVLEVSP